MADPPAGDHPARSHRWLLVLVALAVVGAHAAAFRAVAPRLTLPAAALLVTVIVAKHLGLVAAIRTRWRRGARR